MGPTNDEAARRSHSTAVALRVTLDDLEVIRQELRAASADTKGKSAAEGLGITANELGQLTEAIATSGRKCTVLARVAARAILASNAGRPSRAETVFVVAQSAVFHRSAFCEATHGAQLQRMQET